MTAVTPQRATRGRSRLSLRDTEAEQGAPDARLKNARDVGGVALQDSRCDADLDTQMMKGERAVCILAAAAAHRARMLLLVSRVRIIPSETPPHPGAAHVIPYASQRANVQISYLSAAWSIAALLPSKKSRKPASRNSHTPASSIRCQVPHKVPKQAARKRASLAPV